MNLTNQAIGQKTPTLNELDSDNIVINKNNQQIKTLMDKFQALEKDVLSKDKRLVLGYYFALNALCHLIDYGRQPKQVSNDEREFIKSLEQNGFTLSEIALITDRSKSTIHEVLGN